MNDPKTFVEPLAGYLLDLSARLRNRPFTPHSLTKLHNMKTAKKLSGSSTILEVGTYKGVTARRLSYLFDRVITIEIDEALYKQAKARCSGRNNIEFHLGDGSDLIRGIVQKENSLVIFLDGHFSGGETGLGDEPEPVLKELDLIADELDRIQAVVVDDFRLFGVERGWPTKSHLLAKLESVFVPPLWSIAVLNDQVLAYRKTKS
jgi:Ribosomal RNA adenine dimethylase